MRKLTELSFMVIQPNGKRFRETMYFHGHLSHALLRENRMAYQAGKPDGTKTNAVIVTYYNQILKS